MAVPGFLGRDRKKERTNRVKDRMIFLAQEYPHLDREEIIRLAWLLEDLIRKEAASGSSSS